MNLCLFFEGTGRGVAGKITNVTRLRDICVDDARQKLHLEAGPGTRLGSYLRGKIAGSDWRAIFRDARRWFEANYETLPKDGIATKVFLFGFSRGALIARHFAAWLDKLGAAVAYLGLWDTVDSTVGLDVAADCPRRGMPCRATKRGGSFSMFRSRAAKGRLPKCSSPAATATSADYTATIILSPTLHLHGSRLVQSERDCASNAPPGFRKSSTLQPLSCTTPTTRPRISGARSTAPAAIYPESDCTSLAKDSDVRRQ